MIRVMRFAVVAVAGLVAACAAAPDRPSQPEPSSTFRTGLATVTARQHMAASANPLATRAGLEILRSGGSAVDAAIAIQLVLGLVEPQSSGLGGGAFLLYWDGKQVVALDGRETAPMAADERLFLTPAGTPMAFYDAVVGGRSVGTPGAVRLLETAHQRYGKLPWPRLFEPAIRLSEDGFAMSPRLNQLLAAEKFLKNDPAAAAYFYGADGLPKATGTVLRNPEYAAALRAIAAGGADAFYSGAIAADVVKTVQSQKNAGGLAASDFGAYRAKWREPVCTEYKVWRVCGMPPPSSGGIAVAQMLGIFTHRNIAVFPPDDAPALEPRADAIHLFSEAGRLAFADRGLYVADPDFVQVNVAGLLDPNYLKQRAQLIGPRSMGVAAAGRAAGHCSRMVARPLAAADRDFAHLGHRRQRPCRRDDNDDRGRIRFARDGARLPAEQPVNRLFVRASGRWQTGREPRPAGQEAAQFDGADAGIRSSQRSAGRDDRIARWIADHWLRRQDAGGRARLEPRHSAGHRAAELRFAQRSD